MPMRDKILSYCRWPIAALLLVAGYGDLVRGGITVSAFLLALGYCAAIPWAILGGTRAPRDVPSTRWREALVAGSAVFLLYLLTLSPSTAMWDASEYIAAAYTFGLPHPPGNPLFVILARVFSLLPVAPNVAMRINVLAALCSAVAAAVWYLVTRRVATAWGLETWSARLVASIATLLGATAFTVWTQSVVNEKVYTVSLAGMAIVTWLVLRWSDAPDGPGADRRLVLVAYLLGLGFANHMAGMLPLPAVAIVVLLTRPARVVRWRLLGATVLAMIAGMSPFATQPIRSAFNPPINEGEPTACRDGLAVSCTFSKGTWDAFVYNFNREQYPKPTLLERTVPFRAQLGTWWLYFRWQWLRDAHQQHPRTQQALAVTFLVLALLGAWVHVRADPGGFRYFGPLMLLTTVALVIYLNFRYGASYAPNVDAPREVRDRDYFFIWGFSAWGVWAALGLAWVWRTISEGLARSRRPAQPSTRHLAFASPVLLLAFVPLAGNWTAASRRGDTVTPSFARDLLNSVEPYGVLITGGDNDTFPLWYAQEVEGVRRDVTVAVTSLMNTDWFARGMIRRPVEVYDAARGPAVYRGGTWPRPDGPPLHLTLEEADALPPYMVVTRPLRFRANGLDVTIDPRALPQAMDGGYLERADLIVLRILADTWPDRPLYISRSAGNYAARLGLGANTLAQGLARKVVLEPQVSADTAFIPGSGWIDVRRTAALWQAFEAPAAIVQRNDWVDGASIGVPYLYLATGMELHDALLANRDASADTVAAAVRAMAQALRFDLLVPEAPSPPSVPRDTTR